MRNRSFSQSSNENEIIIEETKELKEKKKKEKKEIKYKNNRNSNSKSKNSNKNNKSNKSSKNSKNNRNSNSKSKNKYSNSKTKHKSSNSNSNSNSKKIKLKTNEKNVNIKSKNSIKDEISECLLIFGKYDLLNLNKIQNYFKQLFPKNILIKHYFDPFSFNKSELLNFISIEFKNSSELMESYNKILNLNELNDFIESIIIDKNRIFAKKYKLEFNKKYETIIKKSKNKNIKTFIKSQKNTFNFKLNRCFLSLPTVWDENNNCTNKKEKSNHWTTAK